MRRDGRRSWLGTIGPRDSHGLQVCRVAGGAYVGNQVEKNQKSTTTYVVYVKMEDGSNRTFNFSGPPSYQAGDKVKVIDKKLTRR